MEFKKFRYHFIVLSILTILASLTLNIVNPSNLITNPEAPKVECFFVPGDNCREKILQSLEETQKSIHMQSYSFTDAKILEKILEKNKQGVEVVVILDHRNSQTKHTKGFLEKLLKAGIKVYLDKPSGCAHNKVIIIDDRIVIGGSYNHTNAAHTNNVENVLIIDDAQIASKFKNNFMTRLNKSKKVLAL